MEFCNLKGKTILVTGASSGIGRQSAIKVSQQGAKLIVTGRDEKRTAETLKMLTGTNHLSFTADLLTEQEMDSLVAKLPALDGVVHCAGIVGPTPVKFIRKENIEKLLKINFEVPVLLTSKVLLMKKVADNASIVFLSTVATQMPYFGGALYNSSKSAIESYSKTVALELVKRGIRSNCLSPGLVNTPLIKKPVTDGQMEIVDESLGRYLKKYPMGIGEPEDVANAIVFFLSDESRWISGTNLTMGGVLQ
ncbi:MAG: SDR family oxidoreductase [Lentimicrobiaceae bacterium]|jgi:NAD(P)-dependent dehydrogenase (short-subunit alcohol dehydrogenase family)|nr:SDR family oxidoreductase [Lentimicrobiaceae bacterium]MCP4910736.1 SDR family oxidoreductase [Bacteroidota bacterium]MBT3454693.1 SDR family oxidoreductase [Lentimicrobiaceae bacterium]MBT3819703.1 SDR family oxidoreductase [Lentimicrobiaceae bacterium]MBT4061219.1 SDR family oxidoreductase [Lentimicrobiaceae bacterium]